MSTGFVAGGYVPTPNHGATAAFHQLPAPYKLAGPMVDLTAPDPRFLIAVARRAGYPIGETYPGLVLMIGTGGSMIHPHERFMVGFNGDNTYAFASSGSVYCGTLHELTYFLRENPVR
jgi:hypothetical protein